MYTYMMLVKDEKTEACPVFFVSSGMRFDYLAEKIPPSLRKELPGFISLTVIGETTCVARFRKNADRIRESTERLSAYLESTCQRSSIRPEVQKALDYIRAHPQEAITWKDLGREVLLAPDYIRRLFKEETGMTLKQCLLRSRLALAAAMIQHTDLGSAEIGEKVGFHQPSYFVRRFREQYGVSPMTLRKWYRGAADSSWPHILPAG